MRKIFYLLAFVISAGKLSAQEILPSITVKNFSGKIIISWRNQYPLEIKNLNIQRSFDSLKNFSTIGSVLTPQNAENGFVDEAPPYNKMYYRLFISFEGGDYIFTEAARPVKDIPPPQPLFTQETVIDPFKKADLTRQPLKETKKEPGAVIGKKTDPAEKENTIPVSKKGKKGKEPVTKNSKAKKEAAPQVEEGEDPSAKDDATGYPSRRIYIARDNNLVISLKNADNRKYSVKFFDEGDKFLFELNRIRENFLIVEKVNFLHSGWFYFELFENGRMIEKNKFFIPRDGRN
ncbi:MAG TPA: hypothetical protein PKC54_05450 [Ferruginibacter sp.]|nr:hypothetical protein [Ferruginibacter sp.]